MDKISILEELVIIICNRGLFSGQFSDREKELMLSLMKELGRSQYDQKPWQKNQ
jgi:hypothetical protein